MGDNSEEARARAEAKFQKQQKAAEAGVKATEERAAQARAVDVNTARLKSLRLAKEGADKEAEAKTKPAEAPAKTKATTTKKKPSYGFRLIRPGCLAWATSGSLCRV